MQGWRKQHNSSVFACVIPIKQTLYMSPVDHIMPNAEVPSFAGHIYSRLV